MSIIYGLMLRNWRLTENLANSLNIPTHISTQWHKKDNIHLIWYSILMFIAVDFFVDYLDYVFSSFVAFVADLRKWYCIPLIQSHSSSVSCDNTVEICNKRQCSDSNSFIYEDIQKFGAEGSRGKIIKVIGIRESFKNLRRENFSPYFSWRTRELLKLLNSDFNI